MKIKSDRYYRAMAEAMTTQGSFNIYDWMKDNRINMKKKSIVLQDYHYLWAFLNTALNEEDKNGKAIFGFTQNE